MEAAISPILAKLLLLALQLLPIDLPQFPIHVLQDGKYVGTYKVERSGIDHASFKKMKDDSKLIAFEAERSRRYGQFYTVYILEKDQSFSVGLTEELKALKPLKDERHQTIGGGKASFRLDFEGRTLLLGEEKEKTVLILEWPEK